MIALWLQYANFKSVNSRFLFFVLILYLILDFVLLYAHIFFSVLYLSINAIVGAHCHALAF